MRPLRFRERILLIDICLDDTLLQHIEQLRGAMEQILTACGVIEKRRTCQEKRTFCRQHCRVTGFYFAGTLPKEHQRTAGPETVQALAECLPADRVINRVDTFAIGQFPTRSTKFSSLYSTVWVQP